MAAETLCAPPHPRRSGIDTDNHGNQMKRLLQSWASRRGRGAMVFFLQQLSRAKELAVCALLLAGPTSVASAAPGYTLTPAKIKATHPGLRTVLKTAIEMGIPTPCLMGSLSYLDSLRCGPLPTNLTQAQRDFFGAHTYERVDAEGTFHSHWDQA